MSEKTTGIRQWGTLPKSQGRKFDDDTPRLDYMRLNPGYNDVRVVTGLATYYQARYKAPDSKKPYGDRVRTAWPTYDDCPVKNDLGIEPKERFLCVVIDRNEKPNTLKILDMSVLVAEQVETILEMKRRRNPDLTPRDFDVTIKFDPKSPKPTGFYNVAGGDTLPLDENDLALINDIGGEEVLNKILERGVICPKRETVIKRLMDLGWDGKPVQKDGEGSEKSEGTLEEADKDDYSFTQPASDEAEAVNE